jgi:Zn-dependent protease with chaperone function
MSTNFFQQQDTARRNTSRLVVLFILAVLALIALLYFICLAIFVFADRGDGPAPSLFQPSLLLGVSVGTLAVVGGGSAYKTAQLAAGGKSVALLLGGREIPGNTREPHERRLLNIVEEMAIASGVPVPPVYVLPDEQGINAFAAGHSPGDAVVAVSQGALDNLTRDELQGVVAHEFSHILNGDMRLNLRLMGLIHGIIILSVVGYYLMSVRSNSRSDSGKDSGSQIALLGLALYILGSVGAFFGMLIQAAVSRQREFLADASAVQFTRNPDGIGGALKKIGGLAAGSKITNGSALEANHFFFADGLTNRFLSLLDSHPPLAARIRRIDPHWDGQYPEVEPVHITGEETKREKAPTRPPLSLPGMPQLPLPVPPPVLGIAADAAERHIGSPTAAGLETAAWFTEGITPAIREVLGEPFSARAVIYGLLLDSDPAIRARQIELLKSGADPRDAAETLRLESAARSVLPGARVTVAHLAIPALRTMSPTQYRAFREQVDRLIAADGRVSLFEFCLRRVVCYHLDRAFGRSAETRPRTFAASDLDAAAACVIGVLAREGSADVAAAGKAFAAGMGEWKESAAAGQPPECSLKDFGAALDKFAAAGPGPKRRLMRGCVSCVVADRQVTAAEYEVLRAVCSSLDLPLPPLAHPAT